ncbi:MAG: hypothetical protein H0X53_03920 [Sphingomonas sp.]|nr:hypothetical protein [Sphingomonas sp.]
MFVADTISYRGAIHPIHAVLVSCALPLFLGALLSDWAYSATYEVQWTNFASWLNAGALLFVGLALVWAVVDSLRAENDRHRDKWIHVGLLVATFVVGFISALVHAKDGWAAMPAGLILSVICVLLALAAIWTAFSSHRIGAAR